MYGGYGGPPMGGGFEMGVPPMNMGGPPMGGPPMGGGFDMGIPPMNMGGPPMGGPPMNMGGPPMGGYGGPGPMNMGGPPMNMGGPPMGGPPMNMGGPPMGGYGGPGPMGGPPMNNFGPGPMNGPGPMGGPPMNMGGPPMGGYGGPGPMNGPPMNNFGPGPMNGPGPMGGPPGYGPGPNGPMGGPGYGPGPNGPMNGPMGGPGYGPNGPMNGPMGGPPQGQYGQPGFQGQRANQQGGQGGQKKALLIGINYLTHQRGRLNGCINDVKNMDELLKSFGFQPQNMRILTDDQKDPTRQPTKANILRDIQWLVQNAQPGDSLFFHFSGHGSQVKDTSGDEDDGMDETILPVDYNTKGQIIDDVLHDMMVKPLPAGCRLTALMDCCHSGTGLDLPYVHNLPGYGAKPKKEKKKKKKNTWNPNPTDLPGTSKADVYLYSGCRDDQTSADTSVNGTATGAMTWAFSSALRKNRNLTYFQILESMRDFLNGSGRYQQVPQLTTGRRSDLSQPFTI